MIQTTLPRSPLTETTKRKIILVTDGDMVAKKAVETASKNIGARCISCSAGNPTRLTGEELVSLIKKAPHDPVVVMLDDRGHLGQGKGEKALEFIANHPDIQVLGALAVASNTHFASSVEVDCSVTCLGTVTQEAVNKSGQPGIRESSSLVGDTVENLDSLNIPVIVGIGDIGKMDGADNPDFGAPLTTRALLEILDRSGFHGTGV